MRRASRRARSRNRRSTGFALAVEAFFELGFEPDLPSQALNSLHNTTSSENSDPP